ncbi:MAG: MBL fold metallo-hydrolase [Candidatus Bathyarchaeia archaeon]
MEIDLSEIECIVISHGHYNHFGGLKAIVKATGRNYLPVIIHADMLKIRGVVNSKGVVIKYPCFPKEERLKLAILKQSNRT